MDTKIFTTSRTDIAKAADKESVLEIEELEVTFVDGSKVFAQIRGTDANTGLAVLAAEKEKMSESTLGVIEFGKFQFINFNCQPGDCYGKSSWKSFCDLWYDYFCGYNDKLGRL